MNFENHSQIKPDSKESGLFIVSTPIGNFADITLRALKTLKTADIIFCEDTRETKKLLNHYSISADLDSYNDHNAAKKREHVLELLKAGKMVALVSDAGTPLVSDPGFKLVKAALDAGVKVVPIPGASSILAALVKSGMPSDAFTFCGFVKESNFEKFQPIENTLIFFEAANRLVETIETLSTSFANRTIAVCRELTKIYEEVKFGSYSEVAQHYKLNQPRGEVVILLSPPEKTELDEKQITAELAALLINHKLKEASELLAGKYGVNKKQIYEIGLKIKNAN